MQCNFYILKSSVNFYRKYVLNARVFPRYPPICQSRTIKKSYLQGEISRPWQLKKGFHAKLEKYYLILSSKYKTGVQCKPFLFFSAMLVSTIGWLSKNLSRQQLQLINLIPLHKNLLKVCIFTILFFLPTCVIFNIFYKNSQNMSQKNMTNNL